MFKSKIKVILTIFEDVKFVQPPSWIFFNRVSLWSKFQIFFKFMYGQIERL